MAFKRRNRTLAADQPHHPPHTPAHPLERLIFFSDAVFAIAITLLIIEIHAPHLPYRSSIDDQLHALANLIPHFVGFFISFWVIGAFWMGHHRAFSFARHWSPKLMFPNMALLCAVAFIPFSTSYMNSNMWQTVPTVFYSTMLMITGLLNIRLVHLATAAPVVDEAADPLIIARMRARGWGVTSGAALALVIALINPVWSQPSLISIPLFLRIAVGLAERRHAGSRLESPSLVTDTGGS